MFFTKIAIFLSFFSITASFGQIQTNSDTTRMDTLYFLNGEVRAVKVVDTIAHLIRFLPEKKGGIPKVRDTEKSKVFSVKFSNGQERIFYFNDSLSGNVLSVLEAKMFMLGEREAEISYTNKWPAVIGFAVGVASPVALANAVLLSPIPPAVTPLHTLIPAIRIKTERIVNKSYLQYDTYLMGYEKVARKKNFMHSILGAGAGLACGLGIWAVLK